MAASDPFKESLADVTKVLLENKPADLDAALASKTANGTLNDDLISTTQKTGEKVSLRRFAFVNKEDGDNFGVYLHQAVGLLRWSFCKALTKKRLKTLPCTLLPLTQNS